ncbi:MAG: flagellar biosynthesis protein FlhF [Deltaproteobacteria bacterium]
MHIKRFNAPTLKLAMNAVKKEFGAGALILETKTHGPAHAEIVAAMDYDLAEPLKINRAGVVSNAGAPKGETHASIEKELKELRELKELMWSVFKSEGSPASDVFLRIKKEMLESGIDERLAEKVLLNTIKGVQADKIKDLSYVRSCVRDRVNEKLSVADPLSGRSIVAFIGPPGVGKTTTIAKLAALQAVKRRKKIALFTMDTYRIAAAEQMKLYGRIMGVPVEVLRGAGDFQLLLKAHDDKDTVFIDTAGRTIKDNAHLKDLGELSRLNPKIRFNLVLNAQGRDECLYDNLRGFSPLPIDSLVFTHLDEASRRGSVLNAAILARKPVSYLSTGQGVPDDIEPATKERLINFMLPA